MPSGYTAEIYEGKEVSFNDFALKAARGMGAAIRQRDDAPGPIADEWQVESYYRDALEQQIAVLTDLEELTDYHWKKRQAAEAAEHAEFDRVAAQKKTEVRARYEAMLAEVNAWQPPTTEHDGLKKLMREQLEQSIDFDCTMYVHERPALNLSEYKALKIQQAKKSVGYYRDEWAKEQERVASRNQWVRDLKNSLTTTNTNTEETR